MSRLLVAYARKHRATAEIAIAIVRRSLVVQRGSLVRDRLAAGAEAGMEGTGEPHLPFQSSIF
jgi:hypothetical protein